ncbi:MAG: hypothetical protein LIP16_17250 [Clostridium sp.]|nr:hypothetical protein [Clostridium sp.]
MDDKMIIDKATFEDIVRQEVLKMRRMYFDLENESYPLSLDVKRAKWKRKNVVMIDVDEWDAYEEWVNLCLGDLAQARDTISCLQAVYDEYHDEYEQNHNIKLDELIGMQLASCDADEFERVRDRFEDEHYRGLIDDDELEL